MYRKLAVAAIILTSISSYAEITNEDLMNEIKALRKEIAELKESMAKDKQEKNLIRADGNVRVSVAQPEAFTAKKADVKKLKEITLKDNPSKADVNEYFDKIDELSAQQNHYNFSEDPQCKMIMKAGKENAELMLERLDNRNISQGYYKEALKRLADDKIKVMIIKKLADDPSLIELIKEKHWEEDAKTVILANYKNNRDQAEWLPIVVSYHEPATYPDLKRALLSAQYNQAYIYRILSEIPEITFTKDEINRIWNRIPRHDQSAVAGFAVIAASYGNRDAFNMLFKFIKQTAVRNQSLRMQDETTTVFGDGILEDLKTSIYDILDCDVPYSELPAWYEKNKDKFVFDENSKRFVIKN